MADPINVSISITAQVTDLDKAQDFVSEVYERLGGLDNILIIPRASTLLDLTLPPPPPP